MKSDSSPERDPAHDYDITREPEVTDDTKKRKRKPYRPGEQGLSQSHLYLSLPGSLCIFISPVSPHGFQVLEASWCVSVEVRQV